MLLYTYVFARLPQVGFCTIILLDVYNFFFAFVFMISLLSTVLKTTLVFL